MKCPECDEYLQEQRTFGGMFLYYVCTNPTCMITMLNSDLSVRAATEQVQAQHYRTLMDIINEFESDQRRITDEFAVKVQDAVASDRQRIKELEAIIREAAQQHSNAKTAPYFCITCHTPHCLTRTALNKAGLTL
jgi:hypothetical protein